MAHRIDSFGYWLDKFGAGKHGWRAGNPASGTAATRHDADWQDMVQEEINGVVEYAGLVPTKGVYTQLRTAISNMITAALGGVGRPYDLHFISGFKADGTGQDLAVQMIGTTILPRAVRLSGIVGKVSTAPTGAALIMDVKKNGTTIFSALPQIAVSTTSLTAGTITGGYADCAAGDVLAVHVTQVGSTIKGQALKVALQGAVL